ncbi:hypothetical protein RZS08_02280, partial [Arthrospira platensis SPKY1]|nr:hypothetical protein [Arthrospira platensis SPKY1]
QPRAPAGAVALLPGDHVARAHHAAALAPAPADADAAVGRAGEAALIAAKRERGPDRLRVVAGELERLRARQRLDYATRVHAIVRIPDLLELAHRRHDRRAVHLGQQVAARLPVAVLAGEA